MKETSLQLIDRLGNVIAKTFYDTINPPTPEDRIILEINDAFWGEYIHDKELLTMIKRGVFDIELTKKMIEKSKIYYENWGKIVGWPEPPKDFALLLTAIEQSEIPQHLQRYIKSLTPPIHKEIVEHLKFCLTYVNKVILSLYNEMDKRTDATVFIFKYVDVQIDSLSNYIIHSQANKLAKILTEKLNKESSGTKIGLWLLALKEMGLIDLSKRAPIYAVLNFNKSICTGANNTINKHLNKDVDRAKEIQIFKSNIQIIIDSLSNLN